MTCSINAKRSFEIVTASVNLFVYYTSLFTLGYYDRHFFTCCRIYNEETIKFSSKSLWVKNSVHGTGFIRILLSM